MQEKKKKAKQGAVTVRRSRKGLTDVAAVTQDVSFAVRSCRGWQLEKKNRETRNLGSWFGRSRKKTVALDLGQVRSGLVRVSLDPVSKEKVYRPGYGVFRFGSGYDPVRRPGVEPKVGSSACQVRPDSHRSPMAEKS